jgi:hypothetical protein
MTPMLWNVYNQILFSCARLLIMINLEKMLLLMNDCDFLHSFFICCTMAKYCLEVGCLLLLSQIKNNKVIFSTQELHLRSIYRYHQRNNY